MQAILRTPTILSITANTITIYLRTGMDITAITVISVRTTGLARDTSESIMADMMHITGITTGGNLQPGTGIPVIRLDIGTATMENLRTIPAPGLPASARNPRDVSLAGNVLLVPPCIAPVSIGKAVRPVAGVTANYPLASDTNTLQADELKNRELEDFFTRNEENAYYVAYAALWHRETALDVVQESMVRLIEYYRDKPAGEWPALFRTILKSKINDARRRRLMEQGKLKLVSLTGLFQKQGDDSNPLTEHEVAAPDRDDGITAPEVETVTAELRTQVAQALEALSERQRQVFILREWRGMTISETAQTLGCSENSVKQHHFRAMRQLRKQLAEVWEHAQPYTP
ncbi:MAG: sigma-70 family RNA polymerase sigma factor [Gammaproteobacteria bacterium]|nr:MAG: sigma-70 family RNA polymerase sigma factor [Gammaproteobacteria bacterium]